MSQFRSNTIARRQPSLSLRKHASFDILSAESKPTSSVNQREASIHRTLSSSADQINNMPPNAAQDKARAMWVKKWYVGLKPC
jgi:hypothetical protein